MYLLIVGTFVLKETYNRTCNSATVAPQNLYGLRAQAQPYLEPNALGDDPDDMGRMVGWWEKYPHKALYSSVEKNCNQNWFGQFGGGFRSPNSLNESKRYHYG